MKEIYKMDPALKLELDAMEHVKPIDKATEPGDSEIQQFYRNKTLFLTGATGFIGKQLLEKLFRSCEIKKAFILIRPKHGASTKERLQTMLDDPIFEPVRKKKADLGSRIVCVEGDVAAIRLGISDANWATLAEEVEIIFHEAATTRFDEPIRNATFINIRGTKEVLKLGKACKNLRALVHVSTAYCHATSFRVGGEVKEEFYQTPVPPATMLTLAETVESGKMDSITANLITGWANTYTFTKAIAEKLVQDEAENLPVCIIRPSIVLQTYREPVPGWLDKSCAYGPSGIILGVGLGILRVIHVNNKLKLSFIPVDVVNNATIAAGWDTAVSKNKESRIYNVSSTNMGVTFRHVSVPMRRDLRKLVVSIKAVWYLYLVETNNKVMYWILSWLLHYIPGYVADAMIKIFKLNKPKELKSCTHIYTKFEKMYKIFNYFLTQEWNFDDTNLEILWGNMSKTDRAIYNFDVKQIDWDHFTAMWCLGVRKYIMGDALEGTRKAVARQKLFKLANLGVLLLYALVLFALPTWLWRLFKCLF